MADMSSIGGSLGGGSGTLAEADDEKVSERDFSTAMERLLAAARQQNPEAGYASIANDAPALLDQLIDEAALKAFATTTAYRCPAAWLTPRSPLCPRPAGLDGKFSEEAYRPISVEPAPDRRAGSPPDRLRPHPPHPARPGRRQCARARSESRRNMPRCCSNAATATGDGAQRGLPLRPDPDRGRHPDLLRPDQAALHRSRTARAAHRHSSVPTRSRASSLPIRKSRLIIMPTAPPTAGANSASSVRRSSRASRPPTPSPRALDRARPSLPPPRPRGSAPRTSASARRPASNLAASPATRSLPRPSQGPRVDRRTGPVGPRLARHSH